MQWLEVLDFPTALRNCHNDILGDWYRDPWGWPELDWVVAQGLSRFVVPRLNADGVKRVARLDVAKENFAVRPAVVLDPVDRLIYQALVDRLSVALIGDLAMWVYGWRLIHGDPRPGAYARNDFEWERYRSHLKRLAAYDSCALTTDIVAFFSSIPIAALVEHVVEVGRNRPAERLAGMLLAWDATSGGRGLPQRSAASAVLAHSYLGSLDVTLEHHAPIPRGGQDAVPEGRALRWMDDIWLFGRSPGRLRAAQLDLQAGMRELKLEMNFAKTKLLESDAVGEAVYRIEHSAVDRALNADEPSRQPLEELVDKVLADPDNADRTTIAFMTTRMREHEAYSRVEDVARAAHRMPHAPDHLARLFRDSRYWRNLQEWYVDYARSPWGRVAWSVAQLGTMFPSRVPADSPVRAFVAEVIQERTRSIALWSFAAQRLTAWNRDDARFALREAADSEDHPLARRSIALAALGAGEGRTLLRQMLSQFEENAVTLAMLEDVDFRASAIKPSADFAAN